MSKRPSGLVRRGTRAFREIRSEFLRDIPGGWEHFICPICHQRVPDPSQIELDHHTAPVWIHDPGNRNGIPANTIRENARLLCAPCNRTAGRGRTDKHVRKLRNKQQPNRTTTQPTPNVPSAWQLEPRTPKKKEEKQ